MIKEEKKKREEEQSKKRFKIQKDFLKRNYEDYIEKNIEKKKRNSENKFYINNNK